MKFSAQTDYGLRAILMMANRYGEGSLSVSKIAGKENISAECLGQVLNSLKRKGLVKSVRGPQGGYVLAKKPSEISLYELLTALDPLRIPKREKNTAADDTGIAGGIFWEELAASVKTGMSEVTLQQLVERSRQLKKSGARAGTHTFHI